MTTSTPLITDPVADLVASKLKEFCLDRQFGRAVVGLSGGVDSAVVAAIAVRALGAANVTGLIMPQAGLSSPVSAELATVLAAQLGIATETVAIGAAVEALKKALPWSDKSLDITNTKTVDAEIADQNLAPRLRMAVLYHFARTHGAAVLGTSNRSEILLGYGTKWGDFAADVEVIGSFFKTDVYALAHALGVPPAIIVRPPTAELAHGVTDESELGATYARLDAVLLQLVESHFTLIPTDEFTQKVVARVTANRHKTEAIPVLNLE